MKQKNYPPNYPPQPASTRAIARSKPKSQEELEWWKHVPPQWMGLVRRTRKIGAGRVM